MIILYIIIVLLSIGVIFLSVLSYHILTKYKHIDKKDKEFIVFVIDMYCEYAETLEIHSKEQHEKIVKELIEIKNKYFNNN